MGVGVLAMGSKEKDKVQPERGWAYLVQNGGIPV
jgi:hypothetical protein